MFEAEPSRHIAVYIKFRLISEVGLTYSVKLDAPITNREQVLGQITKINSLHKENCFTYYLVQQTENI